MPPDIRETFLPWNGNTQNFNGTCKPPLPSPCYRVGLPKVKDFPLSIFLKGVAFTMAPSVSRKSRSGDQREASLRREARHDA